MVLTRMDSSPQVALSLLRIRDGTISDRTKGVGMTKPKLCAHRGFQTGLSDLPVM